MNYTERHSGITFGTTHPFGALLAKICEEARVIEDAWLANLRKQGIKAQHPDDGWVDRKRNGVRLCYPGFNLGVQVGDRIALGRPEEFRIVRVYAIEPGWPITGGLGLYLFFDETPRVSRHKPGDRKNLALIARIKPLFQRSGSVVAAAEEWR